MTAALINSVKHARVLSAIARGIAKTRPDEAPRAIAVEVLMELFSMPREIRVQLAAELIKHDRPEPTAIMEEQADAAHR